MTVNHTVRHAVRRALAIGALAVFGAGAVAANAQQAATTSPPAPTAKQKKAAAAPTLQTIVVTGSLISQTSIVTPSPVLVMSKQAIIRSGYTNISDVLRNISANGQGTLAQSFSFAFASGGAGIALRGLDVGDTLVLIDGERTVPYPLFDDNERNFVDLSAIPFTAVQQVQVLKDGGSALYGSDAIAGVVNVILRKQYQGFSVTGETGTSSHWDGTTEHIGFIGGEGDLATDGYNWYISGDFRHEDQILAKNRSGLWDSLNFLPWGGFNRIAGANPAQANGVTYPNTLTGYLINPTNPALSAAAFLPGCSYNALLLNRCTYTPPGAQLRPAGTSMDLLGKFTKELANGWEFGLQASWFQSRSEQVGGFNGGTGYPSGLSLFKFGPGVNPSIITYPTITVPANYPGNPFGVAAPLIYNFPELGQGTTVVDTNTYRLLATLTGTAMGWHIKGTVGAMYAKMSDTSYGAIEPAALQTALNNGYILGSNPAAMMQFAPPAEVTPTSNMDLVDIHGTHKLFELPGGPVSLAIGAQWVKQGHNVKAPSTIANGIQEGDPTYAVGNEYDRAVFAELQGNPIKSLEVDLEGRYDNYKGFGSDTTPKIGIKYTPWRWIAVRGTWSKGFRVPTAAEGVSSGEAFGAGTYQDSALCPNNVPTGMVAGPGDFPSQCLFGLTGVLLANQHLKNVTSTNWTTGIVLQPIQQFSASVDYYNIKVNNDIIPAFEAGGRFGGAIQFVRGNQVSLPYCPTTYTNGCTNSQLVFQKTPVGPILYLAFPYLNASSTHVSGFDVDLQYHWDMGRFGRVTGRAQWTHELTYQLNFGGNTTFELAGTHGPSGVSGDTGNPKDRIDAQLSWSKGPLTITPSLNFVGHFSIVDPSSGVPTCADALAYVGNFPGGSVPANEKQFCTVGYYLQTNVYASYQVNDDWQVHASVMNLFNKQPPVDVQTYGGGSLFFPYDPALHEGGAVGRFMTIGFTYDME